MSRIKKQAASNRVVATVPTPPSGEISFLRRISISLLALALAYAFGILWNFRWRSNQTDFSHYYVSALAMRRGIDPYTTDLKPLASLKNQCSSRSKANRLGLDVEEINIGTYPPSTVCQGIPTCAWCSSAWRFSTRP